MANFFAVGKALLDHAVKAAVDNGGGAAGLSNDQIFHEKTPFFCKVFVFFRIKTYAEGRQNLPDSHTQIRPRYHSIIKAFKEIPPKVGKRKKENSFQKSVAERQKYAGKLQKVVDK